MNHEDYIEHTHTVSSSDRSFGFVFAVVFALITMVPMFFGHPLRLWTLLVALAFLAVSLIRPVLLAPLNRIWTKFGLLLHKITNPIILGIIFFGVITPTALIMRALKKDPLNRSLDPAASTYWIDRDPPGPPPAGMSDQF